MNTYFTAFDARHTNAYEAANNVKAAQLLSRLKNEKLIALLEASAVDARDFDRALYATEKVIKFALYSLTRHKDEFNENAEAAFKTAMLCARNNERLTKRDIEAALLLQFSADETRKHLVFERRNKISAAAQVQQCLDILQTLKITKSVNKTEYDVTVNAVALQMCETLDIDVSFLETENDESVNDEIEEIVAEIA